MRTTRRILVLAASAILSAAVLPVADARAADSACSAVPGVASVRAPGHAVAWRAEVQARTAVFDRLPRRGVHPSRRLAPKDAPGLLILSSPHAADDRCWLRVRLPWRPNSASGWVEAGKVLVRKTLWRIEISPRRRTLTVYRSGERIRTMRVVVGKPSTPTPVGLFSVTWAIRWHPHAFLGSWVLELTGHSDVLQRYDGGDGRLGIHGRGGTSLRDPLGSASSHGCIRLANHAIDWLVRRIGVNRLPGTPVNIS